MLLVVGLGVVRGRVIGGRVGGFPPKLHMYKEEESSKKEKTREDN